MSIDPQTPLKDFALSNAAARVLEHYRLDYCCGGTLTLAEACAAAGHDLQQVAAELDTALAAIDAVPAAPNVILGDLIAFIVGTHHAFTRAELPRIRALLDKVKERHGRAHPELHLLHDCFQALQAELTPHLMKEEQILFPYIRDCERYQRGELQSLPNPCFGSIEHPLLQMTREHETAGGLLKRLRQLSSDFAVPADGCASYHSAYRALEELERDLMRHIHLENNVLFPEARKLAEQG